MQILMSVQEVVTTVIMECVSTLLGPTIALVQLVIHMMQHLTAVLVCTMLQSGRDNGMIYQWLTLDLDECVLLNVDEGGCGMNSVCTNTEGSFECRCQKDYFGDGRHCYSKLQRRYSETLQCHSAALHLARLFILSNRLTNWQ